MAGGKYPFLEYIEEPDKEKKYKKASDCGWFIVTGKRSEERRVGKEC